MLSPGELVGDRFEVDEMIGRGGLSAVFRVRHRQLGGFFALKLLLLHRPEIARRLLLEGQIQSRLRHPNLLAVSDVVDHRGNLGLVMEYVEPPNLSEYLAAMGPMDVELALRLFAPVLSALIAAHDAGVLHRDLKPANILLARSAGGVIPKIADFGIAKMHMEDADTGATMAGLPMGTPGYMPPEQIRDARGVDHRADLFALGAVLFEMLTGRGPFEGDTADLLMVRTMSGLRGDLAAIRPDCPAVVVAAVDRVLSSEPDDRFADGRAFGAALFAEHPDLFAGLDAPDGRPVPLDMSQFPSVLPMDAPSVVRSKLGLSRPAPGDSAYPAAPLTLPQESLEPLATLAPPAPPPKSRLGLAIGAAVVVGVLVAGGLWGLMRKPAESTPPAEVAVAAAPVVPTPVAPDVSTLPVASNAVAEPPVAPVQTGTSSVGNARPVETRPVETAPVADAVAAPEAPVVEAPVSQDAVAAVDPPEEPAVATPEAPPEQPAAPSYPSVVGEWSGTANGRPMVLSIKSQSGASFKGRVTIQLGAQAEDWPVEGKVAEDGTLSFVEMGGPGLTFSGKLSNGSLSGGYGRGSNQKLKWSAGR